MSDQLQSVILEQRVPAIIYANFSLNWSESSSVAVVFRARAAENQDPTNAPLQRNPRHKSEIKAEPCGTAQLLKRRF